MPSYLGYREDRLLTVMQQRFAAASDNPLSRCLLLDRKNSIKRPFDKCSEHGVPLTMVEPRVSRVLPLWRVFYIIISEIRQRLIDGLHDADLIALVKVRQIAMHTKPPTAFQRNNTACVLTSLGVNELVALLVKLIPHVIIPLVGARRRQCWLSWGTISFGGEDGPSRG